MPLNLPLLKTLAETPGAPGYETRIRAAVKEAVEPLVDSVEIDNMGSLYALKKAADNPSGKKVAVSAHMDEIGFMVTHIEESGFLRFHPLGGFDPKTLTALRVLVQGKEDRLGIMGGKAIHIMSPEERKRSPQIRDYTIDIGVPSREEAEKYVHVGSPVTRVQELAELGDCVTGKSLDNRVSVFVLIEALRKLQDVPYDVQAVFTVQEEVGLRGAEVAAQRLNPDFAINLDVTIANDMPGAPPHEHITRLGAGAAVKLFDGHTICDARMVDFLKDVAETSGVKYQMEGLPMGGTDTARMQRAGTDGAIAGAISIPLRNMHQTVESVHKADVQAAIDLLAAALEKLDKREWSY